MTIGNGPFSGNSGWVIEITERTASIVDSMESKDYRLIIIVSPGHGPEYKISCQVHNKLALFIILLLDMTSCSPLHGAYF